MTALGACSHIMKMFVNRTMIQYKFGIWECILNNKQKATFAEVQSNGELNLRSLQVLSNDVLDYLNDKEIKVIYDPRKAKEKQGALSVNNLRHCEDCGEDQPIEDFHHNNGKPTTTCKKCWNKVSANWSPTWRRLLRMKKAA